MSDMVDKKKSVELKREVKETQRARARKITILKSARKPSIYKTNTEFYDKLISLGGLERLQYIYRQCHIAYCEFFNRTKYDQIEKTTSPWNIGPDETVIEEYKMEWKEIID